MNTKQLPPLEYLNECVDYNPETGSLTWRTRPVEHFKSQHVCKVWNAKQAGNQAGSQDAHGYRAVRVDRVTYKGHRLAYYLGTGVAPEFIDHINGVRDDNRLVNLRSVSREGNQRNCKTRKDNTSGVIGVLFDKQRGKWRARLGAKYIGIYDNKIDAQEARALAQLDAGYHDNHGRVG